MLLTFQKLTTTSRTVHIFVWFICLALVVALGTLRIATQAQFAFASLMLFPVIVGSWLSGRPGGVAAGRHWLGIMGLRGLFKRDDW